jgi:hypothetical protein
MPKKSGTHPARSRGGQSGNRNAFQHGFYAHSLPPIEWDPPPSPNINRLKTYAADTLAHEIDALRVLIGRLADLQDQPDPEMKDPDAPFKTLLSASQRLATLLRIENTIQANVSELEDAHSIRDSIDHFRKESTPLSDLLTVHNLERIRAQLGSSKTFALAQSLSVEDLKKYATIFADPPPEQYLPFEKSFRGAGRPGPFNTHKENE